MDSNNPNKYDLPTTEDQSNPPKKQKAKILNNIIGVFAILLVAGISFNFFNNQGRFVQNAEAQEPVVESSFEEEVYSQELIETETNLTSKEGVKPTASLDNKAKTSINNSAQEYPFYETVIDGASFLKDLDSIPTPDDMINSSDFAKFIQLTLFSTNATPDKLVLTHHIHYVHPAFKNVDCFNAKMDQAKLPIRVIAVQEAKIFQSDDGSEKFDTLYKSFCPAK